MVLYVSLKKTISLLFKLLKVEGCAIKLCCLYHSVKVIIFTFEDYKSLLIVFIKPLKGLKS